MAFAGSAIGLGNIWKWISLPIALSASSPSS